MSIRIYNKNLHSCSFKLIQVNITKKYTKKTKMLKFEITKVTQTIQNFLSYLT